MIVFISPHTQRVFNDPDLPSSVSGITRVKSIKILGVTISHNFSMSDHVTAVITSCAQNLYALRTLRAHGMPSKELHSVFQATVIAKLTYATPAWWGFVNAQEKNRLEAFLRRAAKAGFYSAKAAPLFSDLCVSADTRFFAALCLLISA